MNAPAAQRPIDLREIRAMLQGQVLSLARELAPGGRVAGNYWISKNPTRDDRHAGSFWILLKGPAAGAWRDEAGIRGVDDGDIVDLVRYCRRLPDLKETRAECLKWLGLASTGGRRMNAAELARRDAERAADRQREEQDEARRRAKNRKNAFGLWLSAQELTPSTFPGSPVDRYLKSRAIDLVGQWLEKGRELPGAIRFLPSHDYRTADGEILELPCMIALITGPDGKGWGIHRTWLRPDGAGKADLPEPNVNKARKIWPAGWQSGVIRIAKGAGHLSPEQAEKRGHRIPLVICEGIEDGLACALGAPDWRVWAAGTLGNLRHVPVLPCVSQIVVAADNDWGKPQAAAELEAGVSALRRSGVPVGIARSPKGKDMNDLLKGERI